MNDILCCDGEVCFLPEADSSADEEGESDSSSDSSDEEGERTTRACASLREKVFGFFGEDSLTAT